MFGRRIEFHPARKPSAAAASGAIYGGGGGFRLETLNPGADQRQGPVAPVGPAAAPATAAGKISEGGEFYEHGLDPELGFRITFWRIGFGADSDDEGAYDISDASSSSTSSMEVNSNSPGISTVEDDSSGITLELEMQWDGNPNIVLDIQTTFGMALPVQVKNIGFTGVFRIICKPLVDQFPCFGAISYSLREKKKLDFTLKVIGGEVSAIPGVSDAIEGTIRDAIEDSITWPVRKVIPILPGDYR